MDYQKLALEYLGARPDQLMKFRVEVDAVAIVINNGVKGCPKYRIPLEDLQPVGVDVVALEADEVAIPHELDATRAAEQLLNEAGVIAEAAAHFAGERVTKAMAEEYIHERRQ